MQFKKGKENEVIVTTKKAEICFNDKVVINDVELEGPGEYEVGQVAIEGLDDDIYLFQAEEIVFGSINFKEKVSKENIEKLSSSELLLVRLDGHAGEAADAASRIEPAVIIYTGSEKAFEDLKKAAITPEKVDTVKFVKSDLQNEEKKAYFIELES